MSKTLHVSRRAFLGATAAGIGTLVVGKGVADFYSTIDAKAHIVIIGGGAAGCSLASRLMRKLEHPNITLIDPADKQFYQPGFTFIAAGIFQPNEVWKRQDECLPQGNGFKWVKEKVVKLDPDQRKVHTDAGQIIDYDYLVLTPGLQLNWNGIGVKGKGIEVPAGEEFAPLTEELLPLLAKQGNAHCIYHFEGAQSIWPAIQELTDKGGRGLFTDTYTKHKCGGAPKKICMLTEHLARQKGTRQKLLLDYYCSEKALYDVPYYTPRLLQIYQERNINLVVRHKLVGIDIDNKIATFQPYVIDEEGNKTDLPERVQEHYDLLSFVPPQSAPDFVKASGLSWQEGKLAKDGWVEVDRETLIHTRYPNIVSFGDVAGIPTSKTSAAVRKQLPIVEDNLLAIMQGKVPTAKYNGYACCPIVTEYGRVLLCEFDYDKKPDITFPFSMLDMSHEQWAGWLLKRYFLKPMFFEAMLPGYM